MNKLLLLSLLTTLLAASNSQEDQAKAVKELNAKTYTATAFNYTPYDLFSIAFKDASKPFTIDDAPSAGSVFFDNSSKRKLDNGKEISVGRDSCCLTWDSSTTQPLVVRVVWSVIFDLAAYGKKGALGYNRETSRESAPGSRWCEQIVAIRPPDGADKPDEVFFHFLNDGTVQAQLGTYKTGLPLAGEALKAHATSLPPGQYCKKEIENPFFGVPRKPHME
jgi:hypothetical protein